MDTKKIIETTNVKLAEATEVCVGIHDQLDGLTDALRDLLDNVTFIPSQLDMWDKEDFLTLPASLKEIGLGDEAIVKLTELYYANKSDNRVALVSALSGGLQALTQTLKGGDLTSLLGMAAAFIPPASAAHTGAVDPDDETTLADYLDELARRAKEGDDLSAELLRRYSESVAEPKKDVKQEVSEDNGQG